MQNFHDIIIIGAGPTGLYFANICERAGLDYLILEGSDEVGGQITHLYPEKDVVDIPGIDKIKAKDYIKDLMKCIPDKRIVFNERVLNIKQGTPNQVLTVNNEYDATYVVIATGLGTSTPRPLGVENEEKAKNIIYNLTDFSFLKNKKIAIFGGGDSALDWAKQLSSLSDDVHLIHRRTEFRGNPDTIKDCKNLKIHLPYVPKSIELEGNKATSIKIQKVDTEECLDILVDYVFVNYGNIASQSSFPFKMTGAFLDVNKDLEVAPKIYAIGDVANYENKTRRMAPGINEAVIVFNKINE